ncbi:cation diffusion facilitator family transporter [Clostridium ganghwense]|uniref:Cation diffusion facilitator family transporter n=1 Tax=Clostridium ganghwense TaxID=312089 RepID=A0ABT4CM05_9CLOT|nr:cation diffusion facilitator family transporter [Clostridium ganghwense]MCY6369029.1 cation diffusion facilitator family transporter [Clostridium ganghwense]
MNSVERLKIGNRISKLTIVLNFLLAAIKIIAGVFGRSSAVISDGIHSLSDVMSTFCVILGLKLSQKPEDIDHPYGHEKFEPIITKVLAFILGTTAMLIGYNAVKIILLGQYNIPGKIAIYAAVLSIITKEWMYRYTIKGAKIIESSALTADAWHHRSDAFSSIGTLVGVLGARIGYPVLDSVASIVICIIILKVAVDIYIKAANQLMDHSADKGTIETITKDITEIDGVIKIDDLKTRIHASRLYVDVEISVSKELSLTQAHDIAENVHFKIENNNTRVKHCMVHVNPY